MRQEWRRTKSGDRRLREDQRKSERWKQVRSDWRPEHGNRRNEFKLEGEYVDGPRGPMASDVLSFAHYSPRGGVLITPTAINTERSSLRTGAFYIRDVRPEGTLAVLLWPVRLLSIVL